MSRESGRSLRILSGAKEEMLTWIVRTVRVGLDNRFRVFAFPHPSFSFGVKEGVLWAKYYHANGKWENQGVVGWKDKRGFHFFSFSLFIFGGSQNEMEWVCGILLGRGRREIVLLPRYYLPQQFKKIVL